MVVKGEINRISMLIAKNQKGIKRLSASQDVIDEISNEANKVIVCYGANGKGKSTIKDLFLMDNLEENFELGNKQQLNLIKSKFLSSKFKVFDDTYIDKFIYNQDKFNQNQTKIILKTREIEALFKEKDNINFNISKLLAASSKYIELIDSYIEKISYKTKSGSISDAKKRYATTFIIGNLPYKYDELFEIKEDSHRRWWYEGLSIYDKNSLNFCPWCKNPIDKFPKNIKEQIESVEATSSLNNLLFSDKVKKISEFSIIMNNTETNEEVKNILIAVIRDINNSLDSNVENEIIKKIDLLITKLEHDRQIFLEINENVRVLENLTEITTINLCNKISELQFFNQNKDIKELSRSIDEIINFIMDITESINESNVKLHKIINESEEDLNQILYNLGLKYKIEVDDDKIVSNGLNEEENYIILKSANGINVTDRFATTLSYGEKNTLAFAFFLEEIKNCSDNKTIIIFDDPISSYDLFRRYTSLGLLKTISSDKYKKMIILSHESNFITSIVSCYQKVQKVNCLILVETAEGEIEICNLEPNYTSDLELYKNMLSNTNQFSISQRVLALRKLYELYKNITKSSKMNFYNYLCKLIHYRKLEAQSWNEDYIDEIKQIMKFYGINYDTSIEIIKDESVVYQDIDNLFNRITNKNIYNITPEEIVCLRMIAESAVRKESNHPNKFKIKQMNKITDSKKLDNLSIFMDLLNAITHTDDKDIWPELCLNDIKAIPKITIYQIIEIIK